jgi:hypothetical protein
MRPSRWCVGVSLDGRVDVRHMTMSGELEEITRTLSGLINGLTSCE